MSSGNPFRTSFAAPPSASSVPPASSITSETATRRPKAGIQHGHDVPAHLSPPPNSSSTISSSRTKKHVRIESTAISIPPQPDFSSPDDSPVASFAPQHPYAASSPAATSPPHAAYSSFAPGSYTREPGRSYDMARPDGMASATNYPALSPSAVPANPFAKTLANMEPQRERAGGEDRRASAEGAVPGSSSNNNNNNRASLDVESFKNMLLTGKPYPSRHLPAVGPASAAVVESGSSTDVSSISRQSLLEPAQEAAPESPRTSYEMARSDEDEVVGHAPQRSRSKKKPPPAPAHRHGKLVSPRLPQTVPFDSFASFDAAPSPVTRPRNTSDTSKPLPPTPVLSPPPLNIDTTDEASLSRSNSLQQKKAPPPVPLARRQSQLRHSSAETRSRSSSSLTLSSQHSLELPTAGVTPTPGEIASNATTTPSSKAPPPPPPSRHGARLSDMGSSSANASSTEAPQRSTSVKTAGSSRGPSSRRSTLEGEPEVSVMRTTSTASKRNSLRLVSGESGSGMPPPPPPPRRRPGSGRSSLDQQRPSIPSSSPTESRRTSTDLRRTSLDNNRRTSATSEHSLRNEYVPAEEKSPSEYALYSPREEAEDTLANAGSVEPRKDSNNILDDMEKFQREIDELRNRYKQAG